MWKHEILQLGPLDTNCYIVWDTGSTAAAVIDPGGDAERAADKLAALGLAPRWFFLTHTHYDHMMALPELRRMFPEAKTVVHEDDAFVLTAPEYAMIPEDMRPDFNRPPDELAQEGSVYTLGTLELQWMHTPGHTPGSCCIRCGNALYTGDTLFAKGIGRTDFYGGNRAHMRESLRRLAAIPENLLVFPGHMEATDLDTERTVNPLLRHMSS